MKSISLSKQWYATAAIVLLVCLLVAAGGNVLSDPQPAENFNSEAQAELPLASTPAATVTSASDYTPIAPPPQYIELEQEEIPAQVVIQFAEDATEEQRAAYIDSVSGTVVQTIDALDTVVITLPEETAGEPLPESPVVAEAEPDYYVTALDDFIPDDPRYPEQWALPAIGAPSAWAELPADAPQVTVAVIDSGICASHPDLSGRILEGWDFLEDDSDPQDDFGHGCSVAGIIAANMNDGIGIAGVAPNAQVMPLRVLNASGVGSYSDVAAAIVYAADNGAQVINLSLGGSNPSSTLESAVNYAIEKGVILVAAAGNNGTEGALYPAAYPDVIAVGSVDPDLQHSSFSNYGPQIDIWAPGRDILSTRKDGSYGLVSGTSFAAPYVAGAETVYIAFNRPLIPSGVVLTLNNEAEGITNPTITPVVTENTTRTPIEIIPPNEKIEYVPGEVILKLKPNVSVYPGELKSSSQSLNALLSDLEVYDIKPLFFSPEPQGLETDPILDRYFKVIIPADVDVLAAAEKIMQSQDVEFAMPNYIAHIDRTPNDPNFTNGNQWALTKINASGAWDITTGNSNIVVAVLDTGFDVTHPDLSSKNNYQGYDFYNNDWGIQDDEGHGTAVSGIIAAKTDNGQGVAGVSWGAMVMPVKVCGSGSSGCPSDVIMNGIRWAADHGANVINMSLGGGVKWVRANPLAGCCRLCVQ